MNNIKPDIRKPIFIWHADIGFRSAFYLSNWLHILFTYIDIHKHRSKWSNAYQNGSTISSYFVHYNEKIFRGNSRYQTINSKKKVRIFSRIILF